MGKFEELIKGDKPVLVDFFATWCGPCKAMHPILEELKKEMGDQIHVLTIDVDGEANRQFVMSHQIQSVPTLMIFKKGEMVWRQSGVMQSMQLKNVIEKYL
ncbi:thiol reductase thioredoxin [Odoribacter laneus]|jgi:thioredoxin|uniref:Thioredoxin n=1 Tax=Odoribacter laneus YIT 12061 TaxID=742817 RepID=H1DCV6_9BACT|nr:thioredoxin [Odoribacter laneus]EHP51161.1 thioredoxin [Odoribacter laneus YIT 12061]GKI22606.1 thiol reductase thioredoxin [Odoribacter laneus]GKI25049.1 thiol reductase thioredoxin [Odoribacter laneus]CCZ82201.1 thioredoxin [Odoribacter laneus CAG:561]